jgi:hypothetical protein
VDVADARFRRWSARRYPQHTASAVDRFSVTFSEDLLASAAVNPANYSLREAGPNGIFGDGDDAIYALTPTYSGPGSRVVDFTIDPNPLQPGTTVSAHWRIDRPGGQSGDRFHSRLCTVADPPAGRIENNTGNDSIPGATPLPMTETPEGSGFFTSLGVGTFFSGSDRDYWRFDAEAGDRVTIRMETGGGPNIYPFMYLQNAAGQNQATSAGLGGQSDPNPEFRDSRARYVLRVLGSQQCDDVSIPHRSGARSPVGGGRQRQSGCSQSRDVIRERRSGRSPGGRRVDDR